MKYLVAILFLLIGLSTQAQQRIVIENLAAVDSAWISGGNLFYRKNGNTFNAGSVGGTAPVTSVFGRTGVITAQSGDYASFYQPLNLKLTNFSDLVNGTGWLYNNGSGTYSWSNPFPSDTSLSINNRILAAGTTYTAGNGLTLSGNQFKLGGTISENTTITTPSSYNFKITQSLYENSSGNYYTTFLGKFTTTDLGDNVDLFGFKDDSYSSYLGFHPNNGTVIKGLFIFKNLSGTTSDTSTYKPLGISATGGIRPLEYWPSGSGSGFPSDTSLSINNRILARFPSDSSLSIGNRFLGKQDLLVSGTNIKTINSTSLLGSGNISIFPSDTSASINNRFFSYTTRSEFLDSMAAMGNITINSQFAPIATQTGADIFIHSLAHTSMSNLLTIDSAVGTYGKNYRYTINQGNFSLSSLGGSLNPSQIAQSGATSGQVLKWNGSAWAPGTDNTGGGGSSLTTQSVTGTGAVGDSIKLVNDAASPGNNQVYGTNGSGTKGWQQTEVVNKTSIATGDLLQWDNTNSEWDNVKLDSILKKRFEYQTRVAYDYHNEFINTVGTAAPGADVVALNSGASAATSAQTTDATNRVGLVRTTTGTTATGRSYVNTASAAIRLGGGWWKYETMVNVTTLSTGTERYQLLFGFFDTYTAANQVDGVYFLYDEGGVSTSSAASANWQIVTASNSARTFTTTSTAVSAATWVRLTVIVNADATSAQFFVNGTSVGVHSTNIPSGTGRELGFGWGMIKSVGTTARTLDVDYLSTQLIFTTTRQ
ncbi:hypothetical protein PDL71_15410 [Lacibacter sp. MH-610]|uniref:hypothetical protein n=1 Tax=Lacibacter sp. MH-610 TaxID=3020883 RepID=UPI0038920FB7